MILLKYLFVLIAWLVSLLPFPLLYVISNSICFIVYHLIRYRRKVVRKNLKHAFPTKSDAERRSIEKKFYRNLCDLIVEFIKLNTISKKQLLKRFSFENTELLDSLYTEKKSIIAVTGHLGNWEWMAIAMALRHQHKVMAIVKPLSDDFFEKYMHNLRSKFTKNRIILFKDTFREMIRNKNEITLNIFAADQTPTRDEISYWTDFLKQDTGVFLGTEKIAKSLNFPVVFINNQRIGRGRYRISYHLISEDTKATKTYEITEKHVRKLEDIIRENPDNWLWSHRRWKHIRVKAEMKN